MKKTLLYSLLLAANCCLTTVQAQFTGKPQYTISTRRAGVPLGDIKIELFPLIAPLHIKNFDSLVSKKFYDSTAFHRVIPGFMIQGGDPNSRHGDTTTWGYGNPSQPTVPAEFNPVSHIRGVLSAARDTGINSANSQFFICVANPTYLDGQYCAYGHVIAGMNYVDSIVNSPRNKNDKPFKKIDMFVTYTGSNDSIPMPPTLIAPATGLSNASPGLVLTWNKTKTAEVYRVELSKDSTFSTIYFSKEVYNPTYTITNLDGLSKFYWRVRTNNGGNLSPSSEIRTFTTGISATTLISPEDVAVNTSPNALFTWNKVQGATSYRLQVSKSSTFPTSTITTVYNKANITDTSQMVTGLGSRQKYYWRVRTAQDTLEGFYSGKRSFITGVLAIAENTEKSTSLAQNIPNPTAGNTLIEYSIPKAMQVSIKLYDIQGKELAVILNEWKSPGNYTETIAVDKLSHGTYFYKLQAGDKSFLRKMIVSGAN